MRSNPTSLSRTLGRPSVAGRGHPGNNRLSVLNVPDPDIQKPNAMPTKAIESATVPCHWGCRGGEGRGGGARGRGSQREERTAGAPTHLQGQLPNRAGRGGSLVVLGAEAGLQRMRQNLSLSGGDLKTVSATREGQASPRPESACTLCEGAQVPGGAASRSQPPLSVVTARVSAAGLALGFPRWPVRSGAPPPALTRT